MAELSARKTSKRYLVSSEIHRTLALALFLPVCEQRTLLAALHQRWPCAHVPVFERLVQAPAHETLAVGHERDAVHAVTVTAWAFQQPTSEKSHFPFSAFPDFVHT